MQRYTATQIGETLMIYYIMRAIPRVRKLVSMDTIKSRIARQYVLRKRQKEIIAGSLLGDGHLTQTTRGFAFRVNHGIAQKEYVDWKFQELSEITNSAPMLYRERSCYFRSVSHPFLGILQKEFYTGKCKIIPHSIGQWLTPLSLSVWIMDDGSRDGNQLRINSQSFTKEENEKLIHVLEAKLGIQATLNKDKNKFRLRIKDTSMRTIREITEPYIIPSMRYKFSP